MSSSQTFATLRAVSAAPRIPKLLPHEVIQRPATFGSSIKKKAGSCRSTKPMVSYDETSKNRVNVSSNQNHVMRVANENKRLRESFPPNSRNNVNPSRAVHPTKSIRAQNKKKRPQPGGIISQLKQSRQHQFARRLLRDEKHQISTKQKRKRSVEDAKVEATIDASKCTQESQRALVDKDEFIDESVDVAPAPKRRRRRVAPLVFLRDAMTGQYRLNREPPPPAKRTKKKKKSTPAVSSLADVKVWRKKFLDKIKKQKKSILHRKKVWVPGYKFVCLEPVRIQRDS